MMTTQKTNLPRLYDSREDAAFEDDDATAVTRPDAAASGIRSFFETVVRELERKSDRPEAPTRRRA